MTIKSVISRAKQHAPTNRNISCNVVVNAPTWLLKSHSARKEVFIFSATTRRPLSSSISIYGESVRELSRWEASTSQQQQQQQ